MPWTDERRATAKRLWDDGLTGQQIADQLGEGCTRNAVIGLANRKDWGERVKGPQNYVRHARPARLRAPRQPRAPKPKKGPRYWNNGLTPDAAEDAAQADFDAAAVRANAVDLVAPEGQRCTLLELTQESCRWPIGDPGKPDFFFCGGNAPAQPYCAYHSRVAYNGPTAPTGRPFRD